ncbi:MAG: hypothetical protein OCD00_01965 [Colwellia sp.]
MKNKKTKNALTFILLAVIAFFLIKIFSDQEILPVKINLQDKIKPRQETDKKVIIRSENTVKILNESKIPTIKKITYNRYRIKNHYPTQDVFDDNICNIDKVHLDYKPSLEKAINRLNNQYQHYHYNINKYLELNVYATTMTKFFEKELSQRIKVLHQDYIQLLGQSAKREIRVNLVIAPKRADYDNHLSFYTANKTESLGVYFGGLNIAYIDYQNSDSKALKTAIHETVHALNAHIIGKTPRMFNEGMAEFYENMRVKKGRADIVYYKKQLTKEPYPLMQFFDYQQWSSLNIHHLYYSSWAWIAFMYSDSNRIQSLISFMEKEQIDPCISFSAGESYEIFQEIYSMLEPDFYYWQQNLNAQ